MHPVSKTLILQFNIYSRLNPKFKLMQTIKHQVIKQ